MGLNKTKSNPVSFRHLPTLVGFLFLALFFNGCGGAEGTSGEAGGDGQPARVVHLLNWKDFTDRSILSEFEAETGITVELSEYETNEEMIARVQSSPGEFDVIVVDANLIPLMRELRVIETLDPTLLPNLAGVADKYRYPSLYDPEGRYGVPYLWGTTGMVINTTLVPPGTDSWDALWDPRNRDRIGLLDDVRDGLMPIHLHAGMDRVIKGDLWLAEAYGGDVAYLAKGRDDLKYVLPREGFGLWLDASVLSRAQMYIELGTENSIYQRIFSRMKLEASVAGGGGP